MREYELYRKAKDKPRVKYKGKWAFRRFLGRFRLPKIRHCAGCQEFMSVAFSLGNSWVHFRHYSKLQSPKANPFVHLKTMQRFLRTLWKAYAGIAMNAWVWSAVFHARDTPLTEALDYLSAGLLIVYGLFLSIYRTFPIRQ